MPAPPTLNWVRHPTLAHTFVAVEGPAFVMLHHNAFLRPLIWSIWTHDFPVWTYPSRESAEDGAIRLMNMLLLGTQTQTESYHDARRRSQEG